jgi:hypothetical protein
MTDKHICMDSSNLAIQAIRSKRAQKKQLLYKCRIPLLCVARALDLLFLPEFAARVSCGFSTWSRAARFSEPVTAVKQMLFTLDNTMCMPYKWVHVSFLARPHWQIFLQSMRSTPTSFLLYRKSMARVRLKENGPSKWTRHNNSIRKTYGRIDMIDSLIYSCHVYYQSWKYWHSAKNHGTSLAIVVAYEMYLECA